MKALFRALPLLFAPLSLLGSCGPGVTGTPETLPPFSELMVRCQRWMEGSFENRAQAEADDGFSLRRLDQCRIWPSERDAIWIYSEESTPGGDGPVRQVVYRITEDLDGGVLMSPHTLPGPPAEHAGGWRDPGSFDRITPFELTPLGGCGIHLARTTRGALAGGTRGEGCASIRSGASYRTVELTVGPLEIRLWRRGFDASGDRVWGPAGGPLVFDRTDAASRPESVVPGSDHVPDVGPYEVEES